MKYDFSGWATRNNILCSDGRTIRKDAFKDNDGQKVPLVWNHSHNDPNNVLGHALLENREDGVYAYCTFNDTESGKNAKILVEHGDVKSLSIYANHLTQKGGDVLHGAIREVSLVLAGANHGAFIDYIVAHSDGMDEEAVIYADETIELYHGDETQEEVKMEKPEELEHAESGSNKSIQDILDTFNEEQMNVLYWAMANARDNSTEKDSPQEEDQVKHNVFDKEETAQTKTLSHADMENIFKRGKQLGSLREAVIEAGIEDVLAHADGDEPAPYGIENIDYLYPDARNVTREPIIIDRRQEWVRVVLNGVKHSPFSRIKSLFADITEDEARARGYIKGNLKKEEVFPLLRRITTPTTVYKKQKLDRDDIIDITDFNVVSWLKLEMRGKLDEELARAILVSDGRNVSSEDKINEQNIRPILKDDPALFTLQVQVPAGANTDELCKNFIRYAVKSRKGYRGSGSPIMFTSEDMLADLLLLEDGIGHALYEDEAKLAKKLRVSKIQEVPVFEGVKGPKGGDLLAIIVNLGDYTSGADKGGEVNMFDDFDIDYNQQKYLIETRCSGALTVPFSAIIIEKATGSAAA